MTTERKSFFKNAKTAAETVVNAEPGQKKEAEQSLSLILHDSDDSNVLVECKQRRPRGKRGQGAVSGSNITIRIDTATYEKIIKQPVSIALTVNSLLQYAIKDLEEKGKKIEIETD